MGKGTDPNLKLRCVHCGNTETPLWRAGPDGPKTLCNACGVRYKKGKLAIYKDVHGNLTAVKRDNEPPVHVPPAPKKSSKKVLFASNPPSPSHTSHPPSTADSVTKRTLRKVPSEGAVAAVLAKKPRSRSRRTNAGQLPGRYSSKNSPDDVSNWCSPLSSPKIQSSSPVESPKDDDVYPQLSRSVTAFRIDDPLPYQFDPTEESVSPDVTCLGLDSAGNPPSVTLLPMAADPSSAEQFSFAFAELGNSASVDIDLPDRVEALRGLVLDRTCKVSSSYDLTVLGLCRLCEERHLRSKTTRDGQPWTLDNCRNFVRLFAQEQNVGVVHSRTCPDSPGCSISEPNGMDITNGFMLREKTAYSSAVENFKALMDSIELVGFAESCMVELLCEDVAMAFSKRVLADHSMGLVCRLPDASFPSKPISVPG